MLSSGEVQDALSLASRPLRRKYIIPSPSRGRVRVGGEILAAVYA